MHVTFMGFMNFSLPTNGQNGPTPARTRATDRTHNGAPKENKNTNNPAHITPEL
jgi:hypothetical protein